MEDQLEILSNQGEDPTSPDTTANVAEDSPLKEKVIDVLKTVFDPEIPVNIYELGLIYEVRLSSEGRVDIDMTLTSPMCPVAGSLPGEVQAKVQGVEGVSEANVELVWDPPWSMEKMTEEARLMLGFDY